MIKDFDTKILVPAIVGTTGMTVFSYLYAAAVKQPFKEPELLDRYLRRFLPGTIHQLSGPAAWCIHYLIGALFTALYHQCWKKGRMTTSWKIMIAGTLSGLVGVVGWKLLFKTAPSLLRSDRKDHYYVQLILAHIIFCACARAAYKK